MAKNSFWKCKELFRRDLNLEMKKRMLNCYVKSVLLYGCEAWTLGKEVEDRVRPSQHWCYRRMLKISYVDHINNEEVRRRMKCEENWVDEVGKRKLRFAGHVPRGSGGSLMQIMIEGYIDGTKSRGRPRKKWGDDVKEMSGSRTMGEVKRKTENKECWGELVHNLRTART